MTTEAIATHTVLLERRRSKSFAQLGVESISSAKRIRDWLAHARREKTLWISYEQSLTNALLKAIDWHTRPQGLAVLLHTPTLASIPALESCFERVAFCVDGGFLPPDELSAVLAAENRDDLLIGGAVDLTSHTVTLWRGNLASLTVPFDSFEPAGNGTEPDFSAFAVTDFGHTIELGKYEAASDAVLYEYDSDYRTRKNRERHASEKSFGASLRRLRKQRRLKREDFRPLSPKTIARIEQSKVDRIQPRTLSVIARILQVDPAEIKTY